jgi:hypothetical protein
VLFEQVFQQRIVARVERVNGIAEYVHELIL